MNDLAAIEIKLRLLASKFTGTEISHRLPESDHGSARTLGITFVDSNGNDIDVGEYLLDLADEIAMIDTKIEVK